MTAIRDREFYGFCGIVIAVFAVVVAALWISAVVGRRMYDECLNGGNTATFCGLQYGFRASK